MPEVTSLGIFTYHLPKGGLQLPLLTPTARFGLLPLQGLCKDPYDLLLFIRPNATSLLTSPVGLSWCKTQCLAHSRAPAGKASPAPAIPCGPTPGSSILFQELLPTHQDCFPPAGTGDQALWCIPMAVGQSILLGAEFRGPFHTPATLTTEICWLHACPPAEKGVPTGERSLTLPQQQSAGVSVGPPTSACLPCAVFLGWLCNGGSQRPRAFIKTRY